MAKPRRTGESRSIPRSIDELLTTSDVALCLRVSPSTVAEWRFDGRGPAFVRVEGQIRYSSSALQAYIEANTTPGGDIN